MYYTNSCNFLDQIVFTISTDEQVHDPKRAIFNQISLQVQDPGIRVHRMVRVRRAAQCRKKIKMNSGAVISLAPNHLKSLHPVFRVLARHRHRQEFIEEEKTFNQALLAIIRPGGSEL